MIFVYLGSNISHLEDTEKNITGIELLITHQSFRHFNVNMEKYRHLHRQQTENLLSKLTVQSGLFY